MFTVCALTGMEEIVSTSQQAMRERKKEREKQTKKHKKQTREVIT
jgi:hypothetical protein